MGGNWSVVVREDVVVAAASGGVDLDASADNAEQKMQFWEMQDSIICCLGPGTGIRRSLASLRGWIP